MMTWRGEGNQQALCWHSAGSRAVGTPYESQQITHRGLSGDLPSRRKKAPDWARENEFFSERVFTADRKGFVIWLVSPLWGRDDMSRPRPPSSPLARQQGDFPLRPHPPAQSTSTTQVGHGECHGLGSTALSG